MICFPNIKINLGLHVINRRTDGFHNIETVFYPVSFSDILEIIENPAQDEDIKFTSGGIPVDGNPEDNLIVKAYRVIRKDRELPNILVHLHKCIPMGAGLGGGSSDAAFMIKLLNDKFNLNLTIDKQEGYASALGSDCAFFIRNKPAYVYGKGHELEPFEVDLKGYYIIILNTGLHSNTAMAYRDVERREVFSEQNSLKHILQLPVSSWKEELKNDFELSVFKALPLLAEIKQDLYDSGALYASMSGSGASMFGLYTKRPQLSEKLRSLVCYEGWL